MRNRKGQFIKGTIPWDTGLKFGPLSKKRKKQNLMFMQNYRKTHPNPMENPENIKKMAEKLRGRQMPKTTGENHL